MLTLVQFYFCHVLIVKAKHRVSQYSGTEAQTFVLMEGGVELYYKKACVQEQLVAIY